MIIALYAAAGVLSVLGTPQQAAAPGVIAFVGRKGAQTDLFTVKPDGSDLTQLTQDLAQESEPAWSPDGSRLAYISAVEDPQTRALSFYVYVVAANGSNRVQVTNEPIEPTSSVDWSPDGSRLVFERTFGVGKGINVCAVNADGTNPARLTNDPNNDQDPVWSRSNKIAFLGTRAPGGRGLYSMNPDGGGIQPILVNAGLVYGPPRWSPDGTRIAYNNPGRGGITIALANGSQPNAIGEASPDPAEWSRDGSKVVFADSGHSSGRVMLSVDARVATPVPGTDNARSPTLSPDGGWVAFAMNDGTDPANFLPVYALYVARLGSGSPTKVPIAVRPVVSGDANRRMFIRWSPTGSAPPQDPGGVQPLPGAGVVRPPLPQVAPLGPGFPGAPVGQDRTSNPLGASKTFGKGFTLAAPSSVTVGEAFFGPEPLALKATRPAALAKTTVKFAIVGAPAGLTASIAANPDGTAKLTLGGLSALAVGQYPLLVKAVCGTSSTQATIQIVRKQARILLVDDDYEGNNADLLKDPKNFQKGTLSKSDVFYRKALDRGDGKRSLIFDTVGVDRYGNGPDVAQLEPYDFVLWYLGTSYGGNPDNTAVFSGVDETNVRAYLGAGGGRTFMLVGPGYLSNVSHGTPTSPSNEAHFSETDSIFLKKAIGALGARGMFARFAEADLTINGETFMMGRSPMEAQLSPLNADTATVLATTELDPDLKGKRQVPVATWNRVGDANVIYVGFTLENVAVKQEKLMGLFLGIRIRGMVTR